MIDPKFLNFEIYSIYSAVLKVVGPEKQKEIVRLSGEIMFSQLKDELHLSNIRTPVSLVKKLIKYLQQIGYLNKGEVEEKSKNELLVNLYGGACHEAVVKLKSEGAYPPHFCTTLVFSGLKEMFGVDVELTHLDLGSQKPPFHTVEKWELK